MRRRKPDLVARVNSDLALTFDDIRLTSYAGLALFDRYLRRRRFNDLIRSMFRDAGLRGDFGVVSMVRLTIAMLVVGARRLDHLGYLADDPLVRRFCRLAVVPTPRTVSRWLGQFVHVWLARLQLLNAAIVAQVIPGLRLRTATIDVDGVVVSTGLCVERAFRGYNPHRRKVPSYYPILAHLAETTHVLRVKNRSGDVHDGKASLGFLQDLWRQIMVSPLGRAEIRFRMDGAFFRQDVLEWLTVRGLGYAIKVPFYRWLDLQQYVRRASTWTRVTADVSTCVVPAVATPWGTPIWVAIYRKRVAHQTAKNFQLDLFDPNDGHYEYLGHHQQSGSHGRQPLVLRRGTWTAGENDRAAEERIGLSHGADADVCGQQRVAAARRAHAQPAGQLPA